MSNPVIEGTPENVEPPVTPDEQKPEGTPATPPAGDDVASLPEWAQKQIKDLRQEAADRRTKAKEAEEKLAKAKTPEEFETAVNELRTANLGLEKALVASQHNLPEALAARLQGTTREELEADATALQALVNITPPPTADNLSGGLDPNSDDDGESNPLALAKRANRNRLYR